MREAPARVCVSGRETHTNHQLHTSIHSNIYCGERCSTTHGCNAVVCLLNQPCDGWVNPGCSNSCHPLDHSSVHIARWCVG